MSGCNACEYDLEYWEKRYKKNGNTHEWLESLASDGRASALRQALDEYLPTPGRVLDLGCGTSRLAEHLAQLGHTVDAVDNSTEAIALCSARMRADPLGERPVAFLVADLTAMACYEPGDFDCAVDKSTLDCLDCLGLAGKAASETHRVLKAGGLLVSVSCRQDREEALLALGFEHVHQREVWLEAGSPCPNHSIHIFRKRPS